MTPRETALTKAAALARIAHDCLDKAGALIREVDPCVHGSPERSFNYRACIQADAAEKIASDIDAALANPPKES